MRILKLTLENINSLKGKWSINFDAPDFAGGIFAITGPTGSGKSSVLDSICLALYGRTPRIRTISTMSDEVMNRESSDCMAELEFETGGKKYRAYWSHKKVKARKEGGNQFAQVKTGLEELTAGGAWQLIASKVTEKEKKLEELTQLSFEQFTRSVMLAQNGFAAFLNAKPAEQAETLEKLTGTEIFSKISQKVFEITKAKEKKLSEEEAKSSVIQVFSKEELDQREQELASIKKELEVLDEEGKNLQKSAEWYRDISELSKKFKDTESKFAKLNRQGAEMSALKKELTSAKKADGILRDWEALDNAKSEHNSLESELIQLEEQKTSAEQILSQQNATLSETQKSLRTIRDKSEENQKIYTEVEKLDEAFISADSESNKIKEESKSAGKQAAEDLEQLRELEASIERLKSKLKEYSDDINADVLGAFSLREKDFLSDLHNKLLSNKGESLRKREEFNDLKSKLENREKESLGLDKEVKDCEKRIKEKLEVIDALTAQISEKLQGKTLRAVEEEKNTLEKQNLQLTNVLGQLEDIESKQNQIKINTAKKEDGEKSLKAFEKEAGNLQELIEKDKQHEKTLDLLIQIDEGTKLRASLEQGKPCPVCGALDHPFASHLPEGIKEAKNNLEKVRKNREKNENKRNEIEQEKAVLNKKIETYSSNIETLTQDIKEKKAKLKLSVPEFLTATSEELTAAATKKTLEAKSSELEGLQKKLEEAQGLSGELEKKADELKILQEAKNKSEQNKGVVDGRLSILKPSKEKAEKELKELEQQREKLWAELSSKVKEESALSSIDMSAKDEKIFGEWKERGENHSRLIEKRKSAEQELKEKNSRLEPEKEKAKRSADTFEEKKKSLNAALQKADEIRQKRIALFGDKNVLAERERERREIDNLEQQAEKYTENVTKLKAKIDENEGLQKARKDDLTQKKESVEKLAKLWADKLSGAGFESESVWKSFCLGSDQVQSIEEKVERYDNQVKETRALLEESKKSLEAKKAEKLTDKTEQAVQEEIRKNKDSSNERNTQKGKLEQELETNQKNVERVAEIRNQAAEMKKDYAVWNKLNGMIGSASGGKYRQYVQSLVLISLLKNANKELSKLTDRYFLTKGKELEIMVFDKDLAGEIRPVSNLSGGETFLVSLSLALGLSRMASEKVRIDSLFLDEGFGTLDGNSLEKALTTLGQLQSQGKTVGIISHVDQIKQRIRTQVRLERSPIPGCSVLTGSGVTQLKKQSSSM